MKTIRPLLVTVGLILMLGASCRPREKPKGRYDGLDGGYILREECNAPTNKCHRGCYDRDDGPICSGCCRDQRFLCDTQQPHSFESCDHIYTNTQSLPDPG
jgi:hypothetical protein